MRPALVLIAALALVACSVTSNAERVNNVSELAGAWQGRLAMRLTNAAATLTINPDGAYTGAMYFERGEERPIAGTIVMVRPGRLRFHGTNGDGIVMVSEHTMRFVPDGGGGGGSFTRVR